MIRIIYGKKGSGKTKKIIDAANEAVKSSTGELVFIDDDNRYMYDLRHEIRFVNATEYDVSSPDTFMGFICGILAGNYDISVIYVDAFLKLVKTQPDELEAFFAKLEKLVANANCDLVISFSEDAANVPECIRKYQI